jgi:hypothetical protein
MGSNPKLVISPLVNSFGSESSPDENHSTAAVKRILGRSFSHWPRSRGARATAHSRRYPRASRFPRVV